VDLGICYRLGRGVPQDHRKAAELYEKAADHGDPVGQAYLASGYAEGKGVPQDYSRAWELFEKALDQGSEMPGVLNEVAWFLATCPDQSYRSGQLAVEYATKACELTQWEIVNLIGTLAVAYAETGDFDSATKYQKQVKANPDADYSRRDQMERIIELYRSRKSYRQ